MSLNWTITKMLFNLWRATLLFGADEAPKRYTIMKLREIMDDLKQRTEAEIREARERE